MTVPLPPRAKAGSLLALPDNVIELIVAEVAFVRRPSLGSYPVIVPSLSGQQTLAALCRTCQRLLPVARAGLYRHPGRWLGAPGTSTASLLRTLQNQPQLFCPLVESLMLASLEQEIWTLLPVFSGVCHVHIRLEDLDPSEIPAIRMAISSLAKVTDLCIGWHRQSHFARTEMIGIVPPGYSGLLELRDIHITKQPWRENCTGGGHLPPTLSALSFLYASLDGCAVHSLIGQQPSSSLRALAIRRSSFDGKMLSSMLELHSTSLQDVTLDFLNANEDTVADSLSALKHLRKLAIGSFHSREQRQRNFKIVPHTVHHIRLFGIDTEGFEDVVDCLLPAVPDLKVLHISMLDELDITDQEYVESEWGARWSHGIHGAASLDEACRKRGIHTSPRSFESRMKEIRAAARKYIKEVEVPTPSHGRSP